jgi:taurine transport system permease protein
MSVERHVRLAFAVLSLGSVLAAWWIVSAMKLVDPIILPPPADVAQGARDIWNGYFGVPFWNHFKASLSVMLMGYLAAVLVGLPLGIAMAWVPLMDRLFGPLLAVLRPIPPPAWIPLAILWFGIDLAGKVFIVVVAAIVPCILTGYHAVKETPPELLNAARSLGATARTRLLEVALPSGLPAIMTGLRIALGTAWASIVAAELVVSLAGFGFLISNGYRNLESNIVVCGMVAVSLIGFLMNAAILKLERRLVPWRHQDA